MHGHHMTQLTTPETSTIMLRRNSALAHNKDGSSTATTPKSLNSSFEAKVSPGAVGKKQRFVWSVTSLLLAEEIPENLLCSMRRRKAFFWYFSADTKLLIYGHLSVINLFHFFNISSPRFPIPGETPKLPPKPKQSGERQWSQQIMQNLYTAFHF